MKYLQNPKTTTFQFCTVEEAEMAVIVRNMKPKRSTGHDEISNKLLKELWPSLSKPVTFLINDCLQREYFPQEWKVAKIVPIFKKGDPTIANNYRPISLLCCLSKILEKIVDSQIRSYMNRNGFFYTHQYGFRAGYQCAHAITKFCSRIHNDRKNKEATAAIFLNIRKAFDCVDFDILYDKLEYYGIPSKFFKSYLTNRLHYTEIKGSRSPKARMAIGLPQGGVICPLLFTIFLLSLFLCPVIFLNFI